MAVHSIFLENPVLAATADLWNVDGDLQWVKLPSKTQPNIENTHDDSALGFSNSFVDFKKLVKNDLNIADCFGYKQNSNSGSSYEVTPDAWKDDTTMGISAHSGGKKAKTMVLVFAFRQTWSSKIEIIDTAGVTHIIHTPAGKSDTMGVFDLTQISPDGIDFHALKYTLIINTSVDSDQTHYRHALCKIWLFSSENLSPQIKAAATAPPISYHGIQSTSNGGDWKIASTCNPSNLLDGAICLRSVSEWTTNYGAWYPNTCFRTSGTSTCSISNTSTITTSIMVIPINSDYIITDIMLHNYNGLYDHKKLWTYLVPKGDILAGKNAFEVKQQMEAWQTYKSFDKLDQFYNDAKNNETNINQVGDGKQKMSCDIPECISPAGIIIEGELGYFQSCGITILGEVLRCPTAATEAMVCPTVSPEWDSQVVQFVSPTNVPIQDFLSLDQGSIISNTWTEIQTSISATCTAAGETTCSSYLTYSVSCIDTADSSEVVSHPLIVTESPTGTFKVTSESSAGSSFAPGKYDCRIKAAIFTNYGYSPTFRLNIDASDTCDTADAIAPTTPVADFSTKVPVHTPKGPSSTFTDSSIDFDPADWGNSVCPTHCHAQDNLATTSCSASYDFSIWCKHTNEDASEVAPYQVTSSLTNGHWISAQISDSSTNTGQKTVSVTATSEHAVGKLFTCAVVGSLQGSSGTQGVSVYFDIEFSPCSVPDYCVNVTHANLPSGDEPALFIVDVTQTNTSAPFQFFPDDLTTECTSAGDCHTALQYEIHWRSCKTCSDRNVCDDASCNPTVYTAQPNPATFTSSATDITFTSDVAVGVDKFRAIIVAQSIHDTSGSNIVTSDEFEYWHDGHLVCNEANLIPWEAGNAPGYSSPLVWDSSEVSDIKFQDIGNDICPEYCYNENNQCTAIPYQVLCREEPTATVGNPALVDITSTSVQGATDKETVIYTNDSDVFFRTFKCAVEASQNGSTYLTEEFDISWDYCNTVGVCPKVVHYDLNAAPSDITTFTGQIAGLVTNINGQNSTGFFNAFTDNITATCTVSGDCHERLLYGLEYYSCESCSNKPDCEDPSQCSTSVSMLTTTQEYVAGDSSVIYLDTQFNFTEKQTEYRARIVAKSQDQPTADPNYSLWFDVLVDNYPICNEAILLDSGENKPTYTSDIEFGSTGLSTQNSFTEFQNDICPDWCYWDGENCGQVDYIVVCRNLTRGDPDTTFFDPVIDLNFDQATVNPIVGTDPAEYEVFMASSQFEVINMDFSCRIEATLMINGAQAVSNEFPVKFFICSVPDIACPLANTWFSLEEKVPSFTPPEPLVIYVLQEPQPLDFYYDPWVDYYTEVCGVEICGVRKFEFLNLDGSPVSPLTATQSSNSGVQTLLVSTNDFANIGEHYVKIRGYQNAADDGLGFSFFHEVFYESFLIEVVDPCVLTDIQQFSFSQELDSKTLRLDTGASEFWEMPFWDNVINIQYGPSNPQIPSPICNYPRIYELYYADPDGNPTKLVDDIPITCEFVHDPSTGYVSLECSATDMSLNATTINVVIAASNMTETGEIYGLSASLPFSISFYAPPNNEPPLITTSSSEVEIDNQSTDTLTFTIEVEATINDLDKVTLSLGGIDGFAEVSVVESGNYYLYTITLIPNPNIAPGNFTVSVRAKDTIGNTIESSVTVQVKGIALGKDVIEEDEVIQNEEDLEQILSSQLNFDFKKAKKQDEDDEFKLVARIDSISSTGLMQIMWNAPVISIRNVTQITSKDFYLKLIQNSNEAPQTEEFKWKLLNFTPFVLETQLIFERPFEISAGDILDVIEVYMRKELFMVQDVWGIYKQFQENQTVQNAQDANTQSEDISDQTLMSNENDGDADSQERRRLAKRRRLSHPKYYIDDKALKTVGNSESLRAVQEVQDHILQRSMRQLQIDYADSEIFEFLKGPIPPQVNENIAAALDEQAGKAGDFLAGLFWLPFIVQIVMSGAMSHVWNILNTIQVVNTFPLFKLQIPENVKQVLISFNTIANLKIIPKEKVYGFLDDMLKPDPLPGQEQEEVVEEVTNVEKTLVEIDENSRQEQNLANFGLKTRKILQSAMQLLVGVMGVFTVLLIIFFCKEYVCFKAPQWVNNIFLRIDQKIRYNVLLRAMIESYYGITLTAALSIRDNWDFSTTESAVNSVFTLFFIPYMIGFPIWTFRFLYKNYYSLSDQDFQKRYNSLYLNVDYFKKLGIGFVFFLLFRKLIMISDAIFLGFQPIFQIVVAIFASQMLAQFFLQVKPMIDGLNNTIQIFNECCILSWCTQMALFTDYVISPETRFEIGWWFLYQIYFNIGVNSILIVTVITLSVIKNIKRKALLAKVKAAHAERKRQNEHLYRLGKHMGHANAMSNLKNMNDGNNNNSLSVNSNISEEINIDKIGDPSKTSELFKKKKERTFLQKHNDAKQNFIQRMAKYREEDMIAKLKGEGRDVSEMTFAEKMEIQRNQFNAPPEQWEQNLWEDVVQDPSGNILRLKQNPLLRPKPDDQPFLSNVKEEEGEDWEIISGDSVRQRRQDQEYTNWPLSARGPQGNMKRQQEKKKSDQWSFRNEQESNISDWLGMPKEEFKQDQSFKVSSHMMSDQDFQEIEKIGQQSNRQIQIIQPSRSRADSLETQILGTPLNINLNKQVANNKPSLNLVEEEFYQDSLSKIQMNKSRNLFFPEITKTNPTQMSVLDIWDSETFEATAKPDLKVVNRHIAQDDYHNLEEDLKCIDDFQFDKKSQKSSSNQDRNQKQSKLPSLYMSDIEDL